MNDEITRVAEAAATMLAGIHPADRNTDDLQTLASDAIANILILLHERELDVAGAWYKGAAHYAATYMEPLDADDAADWLHDNLFPFSGENSADVYIARDAITLAGHEGAVEAPEFGV